MTVHSSPKRTIDLLKGYPNPSLLPAQAISDAAQSVLSNQTVATAGLSYGADEGYEPFREAVADWNSSFYGRTVTKDNVVITGGASQNLACVLQVLTDPIYTQNIWIASPAYMLVFRLFQDNGFADKLQAVPEAADGIDVEWLENALEQAAKKEAERPLNAKSLKPARPYSKYYKHVIYGVPTFSNPSAKVLTLEKRKALVRCARNYDALIITDDVYDHLQWRTDHSALQPSATSSPLQCALMPRLVDVDATLEGGFERPDADGFGNTMSNGSFSKIVGPGVRCGWAEGSPKLVFGVSQVGSSRSGGCPSQMTSTFLHKLVSSGWLQTNISTVLQPEYSSRYQIMVEALQKYVIPLGCSMIVPGQYMGGYFIWLKLPPGIDSDELTAVCKTEEDLLIVPGRAFEVPCASRISHTDHVRLCFSWEEKPYIKEGIRRLASAINKMQGHP